MSEYDSIGDRFVSLSRDFALKASLWTGPKDYDVPSLCPKCWNHPCTCQPEVPKENLITNAKRSRKNTSKFLKRLDKFERQSCKLKFMVKSVVLFVALLSLTGCKTPSPVAPAIPARTANINPHRTVRTAPQPLVVIEAVPAPEFHILMWTDQHGGTARFIIEHTKTLHNPMWSIYAITNGNTLKIKPGLAEEYFRVGAYR